MDVDSLAWRTDLALLTYAGSQVEDRGDHLVVRTPANPGFYWGNFLLLDTVPDVGDLDAWLAAFEAELPGAGHRAFGVDGTDRNQRAPTRPAEHRGDPATTRLRRRLDAAAGAGDGR